ncbi:MAG TPA: peptidase, partial [Chitinophagaceae bacterium]
MRYHLFIAVSLSAIIADAQTLLPTPRNIQATYDKDTRSTTGRPGKNYWQNTANYDLQISFDPASRLLRGVADIAYINNSPDVLNQVWFKLYPNYYKKGAPRQSPVAPDDLTDGLVIDSLWINNQLAPASAMRISNTNATISGQSIGKGQGIKFRIAYHYTLNKGSHQCTGEIEPGAAFIAYFF